MKVGDELLIVLVVMISLNQECYARNVKATMKRVRHQIPSTTQKLQKHPKSRRTVYRFRTITKRLILETETWEGDDVHKINDSTKITRDNIDRRRRVTAPARRKDYFFPKYEWPYSNYEPADSTNTTVAGSTDIADQPTFSTLGRFGIGFATDYNIVPTTEFISITYRTATTPYRLSFSNTCEFDLYYCQKSFTTGPVCGKHIYLHYMTFDDYCMLVYVNCQLGSEAWLFAHIGHCIELEMRDDLMNYFNFIDNVQFTKDYTVKDNVYSHMKGPKNVDGLFDRYAEWYWGLG